MGTFSKCNKFEGKTLKSAKTAEKTNFTIF